MTAKQATLSGDGIRLEEPTKSDRFHGCRKQIHHEETKRERVCGNSPYLTVVGSDGNRKQLCKMHTRDYWDDQYESE